jgi:poly(A) polymerase
MTLPSAERQREQAQKAVQRLQRAGFTAFWAGGCVRDTLLGQTPKDYDIATDALPDRVLDMFPDSVAVGKAFGVVRVRVGEFWFEVATFREDRAYRDGRRPESICFSDPVKDANRRDFTVNAMFYDPVAGVLHDFVGGQSDLRAKLIRCVGVPRARFAEDHLRLLRAVRFACTLDFRLEAETAAAIRAGADKARDVSAERTRDELTRILLESRRSGDALRLLDDLGLLEALLPEVAAMKGQQQPAEFHPEGDVFEHTVQMLNRMEQRSLVLAWSALLHDVGKPATATLDGSRIRFNGHASIGSKMAADILKRLRFTNDDSAAITWCVHNHMRFLEVQRMRRATLRRLVGAPTFPVELELHRLDCLASHGDVDNWRFLGEFRKELEDHPPLPKPWVSGHDIMGLGIPEGPAVGRWHRRAYDAQLGERFKSRTDLLAWLKKEVASSSHYGHTRIAEQAKA